MHVTIWKANRVIKNVVFDMSLSRKTVRSVSFSKRTVTCVWLWRSISRPWSSSWRSTGNRWPNSWLLTDWTGHCPTNLTTLPGSVHQKITQFSFGCQVFIKPHIHTSCIGKGHTCNIAKWVLSRTWWISASYWHLDDDSNSWDLIDYHTWTF